MKIIISKCNMYKGVLKFNYFFCWELILLEVGEWGTGKTWNLQKRMMKFMRKTRKKKPALPHLKSFWSQCFKLFVCVYI